MKTPRSALILLSIGGVLGLSSCQGGNSEESPHVVEAPKRCDHNIDSIPYVVRESGRYCVTSDLRNESISQDAIVIDTHGVEIDGGNFLLSGPRTASNQLRGIIAYDKGRLKIHNLRIDGFHVAILLARTAEPDGHGNYTDASSAHVDLNNIELSHQTFQALHVRADDTTISNTTIRDIGGSDVHPHSYATGMQIVGNRCKIVNNRLTNIFPVGNGEAVGIAVYDGIGCEISDNQIEFTQWPRWGENFGMWIGYADVPLPLVERNMVRKSSYAAGPFGSYANNSAQDVACSFYVRRPPAELAFDDKGGNRILGPSSAATEPCKNDVALMISRFQATHLPEAAYAVGRAWQEQTALRAVQGQSIEQELVELFTWLLVAAELGHPSAKDAVTTHAPEYTPAIRARAETQAFKILAPVAKSSSDKLALR